MIRRLWIAAGTTEGRMLTEKLAENDDYGRGKCNRFGQAPEP